MFSLYFPFFLIYFVKCDEIEPTTINSTGSYYISSQSNSVNYFQFDSILCEGSNCYVICDEEVGCYGTNIYPSNKLQTLTVECIDQHSCSEMNITTSLSISTITISCFDINSCLNAHIMINNASLSTLNCQNDYGCDSTQIYCPHDSICNINCLTNNSCSNMDIFVSNKENNNLYLNCMNSSCDLVLNCIDNGGSSDIYYLSSSNEWKCNNYGCCPFNNNEILMPCEKDTDCIINCSSSICTNKIINASLTKSLTIHCNSFQSCAGSTIYCPTAAGNATSCNIVCSDYLSCNYASVVLESFVNELTMMCNSANSCNNMRILDNGNIYINSVVLSCTESLSCSSLTLDLGNTQVNSLNVDCGGDNIACYRTNISAIIDGNVNINCVYMQSCFETIIYLRMNKNANASIICDSGYYSNASQSLSGDDDGACHQISFTAISLLHSSFLFPNNRTNNVEIYCYDAVDCYQATFNLDTMDSVQVYCDSSSSCELMKLFATETNSLSIECSDRLACQSMKAYCPYLTENACNINCGSYDYVCRYLYIFVPNHYLQGYLNLQCSSPLVYNSPCQYIRFECMVDEEDWVYNKNIALYDENEHGCTGYGTSSVCCPWSIGGIISCNDNENCTINCSVEDCSNGYIDASNANSLTIQCSSLNETDLCSLSNALIICPDGGCTIICGINSLCYDTIIYYFGESNGVTLQCNGYLSCDSTYIYATYADIVHFNATNFNIYVQIHAKYATNIIFDCQVPDNLTLERTLCSQFTVDGDYAQNVYLTCNGTNACYDPDIYVQYTNMIKIWAVGDNGWIFGYLWASYANMLYMYFISGGVDEDCCGSDRPIYAVDRGRFWIPFNSSLNCYGYGCYYLGDIYPVNDTNIDSMDINMNTCDQCIYAIGDSQYSVDQCIDVHGIEIICDNGAEIVSVPNCTDTNLYGGLKSTPINCGCDNFVVRAKNNLINDYTDEYCFGMPKKNNSDEETNAGLIVAIIIVILIVIGFLIFIYKRYCSGKVINDNRNINNNEMNANIEMNKKKDESVPIKETTPKRTTNNKNNNDNNNFPKQKSRSIYDKEGIPNNDKENQNDDNMPPGYDGEPLPAYTNI